MLKSKEKQNIQRNWVKHSLCSTKQKKWIFKQAKWIKEQHKREEKETKKRTRQQESATMKSFENEKNTEVESDCRYFDLEA